MANQAAIRFVKQLFAAFSRFPVTNETRELYANKLSNWRLTQNEWDDALDKIIDSHKDENIPALSEIYGNLKNVTARRQSNSAGGLATFDLNGHAYGLRVQNDGGVWLIADVVSRDTHGVERHLQQNAGKPFGLHVPFGATNILVHPDNPADPLPEDIPDPGEVSKILGELVGVMR